MTHCGRCGDPQLDDGQLVGDHDLCVQALALEPPRYCSNCRRRLVVQVLPTGWTARCSTHGELRVGEMRLGALPASVPWGRTSEPR
jgi:hypothetical protein